MQHSTRSAQGDVRKSEMRKKERNAATCIASRAPRSMMAHDHSDRQLDLHFPAFPFLILILVPILTTLKKGSSLWRFHSNLSSSLLIPRLHTTLPRWHPTLVAATVAVSLSPFRLLRRTPCTCVPLPPPFLSSFSQMKT